MRSPSGSWNWPAPRSSSGRCIGSRRAPPSSNRSWTTRVAIGSVPPPAVDGSLVPWASMGARVGVMCCCTRVHDRSTAPSRVCPTCRSARYGGAGGRGTSVDLRGSGQRPHRAGTGRAGARGDGPHRGVGPFAADADLTHGHRVRQLLRDGAATYLTRGDVAMVTMQYSKRPSPLSLFKIDDARSRTGCCGRDRRAAAGTGRPRAQGGAVRGEPGRAHQPGRPPALGDARGRRHSGSTGRCGSELRTASGWMREVTGRPRPDVDPDLVAVVNDFGQIEAMPPERRTGSGTCWSATTTTASPNSGRPDRLRARRGWGPDGLRRRERRRRQPARASRPACGGGRSRRSSRP